MRNRALTLSIGLGIAGLIIVLLAIYAERGLISTYHQHLPYITALDKINGQVSAAHIALEEVLAGDPAVSFETNVAAPLGTALVSLKKMYNEPAAGDEDSKAFLKESIFSLEKLIESGNARWKNHNTGGKAATDSTAAVPGSRAGDAFDRQFDSTFDSFQGIVQKLNDHLTNELDSESAIFNTASWVGIILLIGFTGTLCFIIFQIRHKAIKMDVEHQERLAQQNRSVQSVSSFIESISSGNYSTDIELEADGSGLATTLLSMRDKLRINAEDDNRRNWSTSGLAQIGQLLRVDTSSITELFDNIVKFVVRYTKSNQGGLFILNEDNESDTFLELVACYAFERKKYLTRRIDKGEGLVGQCYLEGERIYLLEVPPEYISITSGLGGSAPNALLLVPLKVNDKIFGVLELATFGKYQEHEIELVEKLTESIASTISSVRVSESTRILLEKTQQQAEEMRAQEEEMRQNMEELEATQEEMRRKEKHIQNMLDSEKKRNEISHNNRQVVMELTKNKDIQDGKWQQSLEKITAAISRQLNVSRCSIWEYHHKENKMVCSKRYLNNSGSFESGATLSGRDFPGYFEAITREEIVIAKDANVHPATREFSNGYYQSLSIQSVLSVPFFNEGKIAGIISCEHQHEQRDWTEEDIEFLKACADLITVALNTSKINAMLEQLGEDQETMQTIIDNLPRAVFWKDKELRFQGCNKIFADVAGMKSPKDLIGKTDYEMPWKENGDAYRADDKAVMDSRKPRLDLEERLVNSEGVESWVMTSKVPVLNKHAEVVAVLGMFEDITERKRKEAQIEATMKELETLRKLVGKQSN